jgi:ubiquinone/menaquinone biosynthesis C-methylase UbiE
MNKDNSQEQIAAATFYEELFVPSLFKQWVPLVLSSANVQPGHRVLDVACGTGILAREAASMVGPSGYTSGLDIDRGMLEVARRIAPAIDWKPSVHP